MEGNEERLRVGASSWSAPSWEGAFYPPGMRPAEYLAYYASRFDTVEIDATFYRIPSQRMVDGWRERTPPGFLFAAKVPQAITHEKVLEGCAGEFGAFLRVMDRLGDRLGPLLFQFRYFRRSEFPDPRPFIERLERFLPALPRGRRFAVEVRNKAFVVPRLLDLLRGHRVALALIDHPWFHRIDRLMRRPDILTADFAYIRWLGDRHAIERRTGAWNRLVVDRGREMSEWIPAVRAMLDRDRTVYGYFNNHYAGYAIGSIGLFREQWARARRAASP
ncbi:MAG: DUF72 domain-containing protein [Acidobacteriota bacterium]